ncbi:hypothetical protein MNBD_BACTEROID05-51, partial [hydrothermal vent metagenome]
MKKNIWEKPRLYSTLALVASLACLEQNTSAFAAEKDAKPDNTGFEEIVVTA